MIPFGEATYNKAFIEPWDRSCPHGLAGNLRGPAKEILTPPSDHITLRRRLVHLCTFARNGIPGSRVMLLGWEKSRLEVPMRSKQIKLMADVCLGVAVTSLYTLVGMGLIIVFM
jgi:hypothetical protein